MPQPTGKKQQDKPAPIAINLDTLEREGRVEQPFVVVLGGRRYELPDPQEIDFRDLNAALRCAEASDYEAALLYLLPEGDRTPFFANRPIPPHKLTTMFDGYMSHYGLPTAGEADASPSS